MTDEILNLLQKSIKEQELLSIEYGKKIQGLESRLEESQTRMDECDKEREKLRQRVGELEHLPEQIQLLSGQLNILLRKIGEIQ